MQRAKARQALELRKKYEKYRYYIPNGKAQEFIDLVGSGDTFICLFSAANGVGKTAVGCNILANIFFQSHEVTIPNEYPYEKYAGQVWDFFDAPLYKDFPYLKRGRIISDHTTVSSTMIPELKKWLPEGKYRTSKESRNYEYKWETTTGFEFDVMTYDQNVKEFESANLGWAWFDEPPPEAIFKATVARMRRGGIIFITATPLTGSAWMYDQIMTNVKEGQRAVVEADVWSNSIERGVRGILAERDINRMIEEYSEEDKQARIHGKFQHLVGLVFKTFSRKIHVIKPFNINKEDYVVYERLDPHPRHPDAVLWVAVDKQGTKFVVDELMVSGTTGELATRIKQKSSQYRIGDRRIDPSAFIQDQHTNKALAVDLRTLGLDYLPATKRRSEAITSIKDALDYRSSGESITRPPELYIFDTCQRLIWEMEHWQYHEYTSKTEEVRGKSEKPVDKDDHMIENLGRALLENRGFYEMEKPDYGNVIGQNIPVLDPYAE